MRFYFIANPAAGRGRARRLTHDLIRELRACGGRVILKWTEAPGHARDLARRERDVDAVVAVGGDGTVHEVANGILDADADVPLGVAPFGSGNDFARAIRMPRHPRAVARSLAAMNARRIDVGQAAWKGVGGDGTEAFVNAMGCGFDAFVASEVVNTRRMQGHLRYLATVFRCLRKWDFPSVRIRHSSGESRVWRDPLLLCTTGIGTSSGGGFLLTPEADPADGLFDVCIAREMPLHRILQVLPLALMGRHLGAREVTYVQADRLVLTSSTPLPVHLDGEVITRMATQVEARIVPAALQVLTGAAAYKADSMMKR